MPPPKTGKTIAQIRADKIAAAEWDAIVAAAEAQRAAQKAPKPSKTIAQIRAEKAAQAKPAAKPAAKPQSAGGRRVSESRGGNVRHGATSKDDIKLFVRRMIERFPTIKPTPGLNSLIKDDLIDEWGRLQKEIGAKYNIDSFDNVDLAGMHPNISTQAVREASGRDHAEYAARKPKKQLSEAEIAAAAAQEAKNASEQAAFDLAAARYIAARKSKK
jgi:hypothetical protein